MEVEAEVGGGGFRDEEGMSGSIHRLSQEKGEDVWRETGGATPLFLALSFLSLSGKTAICLKKTIMERRRGGVGWGMGEGVFTRPN